MRRFFFHYNKPASLKAGHPVMSVHTNNACLLVDNIVCYVPVRSKINKKQPHVTMQGYCENVEVLKGTAYIK